MRSILLLRSMKLKEDIKLVGIMTVITLIMIGVFSSFDYSPQDVKIGIVDEDQSQLSQHIIKDLQKLEGYDFKLMTLEEAKESVKDEDISGAFFMKKGFMTDVLSGTASVDRLLIQENMNNMQMNSIFQSTLNRALKDDYLVEKLKVHLETQGLEVDDIEGYISDIIDEHWSVKVPVSTEVESFKEEDEYSPLKQSVIGFSLFFAMFTVIFAVSDILMEKEQFTWHRQMITPISKLSILAGHMSFVFLLGFMQVSTMFLVSKYLFKVEWVGNMLHLLIVIAAFVFCVASMGMFISNFVKTMGQLSAVSPIIITGSAMLGGCFWPLEIVTSKPLLFLSLFTPQRWAIEGIYSIIVYNEGLNMVVLPITILLGMGTLYLLMGAWLLNKRAV